MSTQLNSEKHEVEENQYEDFATVFEQYNKDFQELKEGTVVKGVVIGINDKMVAVDIGGKSDGYVPISEFKPDGEIKVGDVLDFYLEKLEDKKGELHISRENARRYLSWQYLHDCMENKTIVEGHILGKVKGGFAVEIANINTFLPRSQVDTVLLSEGSEFIGKTDKFMVLKIDEVRGNIVISRRAIMEKEREKEREEILSKIAVGDIMEGIVKNLTDYGAFIDFGSFDGLLHLTDISWCRVRHPSEILSIGQKVKVVVIKYDEEHKRVSLGMKQLNDNPWTQIEEKHPVGSILRGKITNIANYGIFVEIENGIEGLVHISEMSWLKNNVSPFKEFKIGEEVDVMVLEINAAQHRISLGIKQCDKNPWQTFAEKHKVGDILEGTVKNIMDFGIFVGLEGGVDGLIHISDLDWGNKTKEKLEQFKVDNKVKVMLLSTNYEKERIGLGIKQLDKPDFLDSLQQLKEGAVMQGTIMAVKKEQIEVEVDCGVKGIVKRGEASSYNAKKGQDEKYFVGDRLEVTVVSFNSFNGKLVLSVPGEDGNSENSTATSKKKAANKDTETEQYLSTDDASTNSLRDILTNVLEGSNLAVNSNVEAKTSTKHSGKGKKAKGAEEESADATAEENQTKADKKSKIDSETAAETTETNEVAESVKD